MDGRAFIEALSPNTPLGLNDARYCERPVGGGDRLASLVSLSDRPVLAAGPAGAGKSTELARAAGALQKDAVAVLVQLDRLVDLDGVTADAVFEALRGEVSHVANQTQKLGVDDADLLAVPFLDRLLETLRRVADRSRQGRVALLVDGLEKAHHDQARRVVLALSRVGDADLVLTAPPALVTGPEAFRVLEEYRLFSIGPIRQDLAGPFLRGILDGRLPGDGRPRGLAPLIDEAIKLSGGVPRVFLNLLGGAVVYAALADRAEVAIEDFEDSIADQRDALERVLVGEDLRLVRSLAVTDEVPTGTFVRLLTHGALLERRTGGEQAFEVNPLLTRRNAA